MPTTVTIPDEVLDKLTELKRLRQELGERSFFKTDIVQDLVDDELADARHKYYEAKAEPYLRARRHDRYPEVVDYWTRDRILNDLANPTYRAEYQEEASLDRYARDLQDALLDLREWQEAWLSEEMLTKAPTIATAEDSDLRLVAVRFPDTSMAPNGKQRGIGNAGEIALRNLRTRAENAIDGTENHRFAGTFPVVVPTTLSTD